MVPEDEREARCQELIEKTGWQGPVFQISALNREGTQGVSYKIMDYIEERRERALNDEEFAESIIEERAVVEEEARERMEELAELRRQAAADRKAARSDDDDDDYDVEVEWVQE